ncbi:hypothetical protein EPD65_16050, partial [Nocardioides jejuensis]
MKKLAVALVAVSALSLAACGGSDTSAKDTASPSPSTLTKAEYLKQADALCAGMNASIDKASQTLGDSPDAAALEAFTNDTVLPTTKKVISKIEALTPPAELKAQVDAMLTEVNAQIAKVEA